MNAGVKVLLEELHSMGFQRLLVFIQLEKHLLTFLVRFLKEIFHLKIQCSHGKPQDWKEKDSGVSKRLKNWFLKL